MIYKQKKTIHIVVSFLIITLILLVISAFIKIPYQISTYSEVFPKEKWLLTHGTGGELISHMIDFEKGHTTLYDISQFERGEFVSVNLDQFLKGRKEISVGDTIVTMQSSNITDQLITAEGELNVAIASLKSQSSAQKKPLIEEAENRLRYTEERLIEQKILYDRAKQLFEKGVASQQEYELQKWTYDLLEIEKKIFLAQLENLKTGVKPEDVNLLESQINSLNRRLAFLKDWNSKLAIISPIDGKIITSLSPDTLLNVVNFDQIILHTPIKIYDLTEFEEGQKIELSFTDFDGNYSGVIVNKNQEIKIVSGQQVAFISILIDNVDKLLLPGMLVESSLILNEITLFDYIIRLITN